MGRDFALLNGDVLALHQLTRGFTDRAMEQKGGQKPSRRSTPTVSDWPTGHMHNQSSLCISASATLLSFAWLILPIRDTTITSSNTPSQASRSDYTTKKHGKAVSSPSTSSNAKYRKDSLDDETLRTRAAYQVAHPPSTLLRHKHQEMRLWPFHPRKQRHMSSSYPSRSLLPIRRDAFSFLRLLRMTHHLLAQVLIFV